MSEHASDDAEHPAQAYGRWLANQNEIEVAESTSLDHLDRISAASALDGAEWPDQP
ncbi:hypothetical protein AB0J83_03315 [Actinoplanes sp. NPDC049596]|uniref:hypothetical protein n=1 Tax=unclassified Actinoplanes TaxID=2626549 RepID=UPI0034464745